MPSGRHGIDRETVAASQRERLLNAIAEVVAEEGYAATSVSAIVARAGTSKRTFYEHFEDKEDCFLHAYDQFALTLFNAIASSLDLDGDPSQRVNDAVCALVTAIAAMPQASQTFLVDIGLAGPAAMDRRAEFMHRFAERYIAWRRETRERNPELPELTPLMALTSVLSVTEAIALKARHDGVESVGELADELVELSVWFSRTGEVPDS